jgi:hypothetical protein
MSRKTEQKKERVVDVYELSEKRLEQAIDRKIELILDRQVKLIHL